MKIVSRIILAISGYLFFFSCTTTDSPVEGESIASVVAEITAEVDTDVQKMERIYYFVRDEIEFGWVYPQDIPPEQVLWNGRGVCMQKCNLLVAMAREAGLKARFHFMYVCKNALEDLLPGYAYNNWPDPFVHTFPEVFINDQWVSMEATFDEPLHEVLLEKNLNFARNPDIRNSIENEFNLEGVKAHQQYQQVKHMESFYGENLAEFLEYLHKDVSWFKRMMQPKIFRDAQKIMDQIRGSE